MMNDPSPKVLCKTKNEMVDNGRTGVITVADAGRRGGRSTLEHHGVEFFREIGRKGGQRTAQLYSELLKEFGRKGGRPRRPTLNDHMGERDR